MIMDRFVNLLANDLWSEADLNNHVRSLVNAGISPDRQQELRTIMIGHISGMRLATATEMQEVGRVKILTETAGSALIQARLDMLLLHEALALEVAQCRLLMPVVPDDVTDGVRRASAQLTVSQASPASVALVALRNPENAPAAV